MKSAKILPKRVSILESSKKWVQGLIKSSPSNKTEVGITQAHREIPRSCVHNENLPFWIETGKDWSC